MATINSTHRNPFGRAWDQFRAAAAAFGDDGLPPAVARAMRSLATAIEYEDRPLIRSHLETAFAAMTDTIGEALQKRLDWSRSIRANCRRFAEEVGGSPSHEFDEVARAVEGTLDAALHGLTDLLNGAVRELNRAGVEVPGASDLEIEIRELAALKTSLIGGWPLSHLPLPASDPAMLARSRAETQRGLGVPIEELIRAVEAGE